MEITFDDRTESFRAGDGLFIRGDAGGERHRAKTGHSGVELVLVEDA